MVGYLPHCTFNLNARAASIDTPLHCCCPSRMSIMFTPTRSSRWRPVQAAKRRRANLGRQDRLAAVEATRAIRWACKLRDYVAANPALEGVMLAGHGIICWADSAKACYDHTVG